MMKIGKYTVYTHLLDYFRLDGGSMFGVVPKVLWEKHLPSDSSNRIPLCTRALILESGNRKIMVDAGCGTKWDQKRKDQFEIQNKYSGPLHQYIPDVTDLVLSHLHFDHGGGGSYFDDNGVLLPSFPSATLYLSDENMSVAKNPGTREKGSYLQENVDPLEKLAIRQVKDDAMLFDDIKATLLFGHTSGMILLTVYDSDVPRLVFVSDLVPTHHHIPVPYVMGFDLHAERSMKERERFYDTWVEHETILVFPHDREVSAGILKKEHGRYSLKKSLDLDSMLTR
jgi:glyoxylase-like metal-dependent hydrolase (beta-lactamase superfamily II)